MPEPRKMRKLPLAMKKGMLLVKETTHIPLKDNVLLQTAEYTFFCNTQTFNKLVGYAQDREDNDTANKLLEKFFLQTATAVNLQSLCHKIDVNIKDLMDKGGIEN